MFNGEDVRVREAKCPKGGETKLVQKYACIVREGGEHGPSGSMILLCRAIYGRMYESESEGFWGRCGDFGCDHGSAELSDHEKAL